MTEDERRYVRLASQVLSMVSVFDYAEVHGTLKDIELTNCAQDNLKKVMKKIRIKRLGLRRVLND